MPKASSVPTQGSECGKKQFGEHQSGDGAVEEKVVPLDRGADGGGDHGAAKLYLMFGRGEGDRDGIESGHERCLSGRRPPSPVNGQLNGAAGKPVTSCPGSASLPGKREN